MNTLTLQKPINEWAAEDRPREKMSQRGLSALTDVELVATLLASGTRELSAIDLARLLIDQFGGLHNLSRATMADLVRVRGVGIAKAATIMSAFELARRKMAAEHQPRRLDGSGALSRYLIPKIGELNYEVFYVIFLDRQNQVVGEKELFKGGLSHVAVDGCYVFQQAISHNASAVIVAHNHPAGSVRPSRADDELTQHLVAISRVVGITLIDHMIVSHRNWYSYADLGMLQAMSINANQMLNGFEGMAQKYKYDGVA